MKESNERKKQVGEKRDSSSEQDRLQRAKVASWCGYRCELVLLGLADSRPGLAPYSRSAKALAVLAPNEKPSLYVCQNHSVLHAFQTKVWLHANAGRGPLVAQALGHARPVQH